MSSVLPKLGTPHGGHSNFNLTKIEKLQAHRYVVFNREGVKPYINAFRDHIRRTSKGRRLSPAEIEKKVNKDFVDWFQELVSENSYFIKYTLYISQLNNLD
ncbi:hypothetical protein AHAS_Ahas11G0102100 [Arachis hypogaea]